MDVPVDAGEDGGDAVPAMYVEVEHRPTAVPPVDDKPTVLDSLAPLPVGGPRPPSRYVVTVKLECPDGQVITQAWTLTASAGSLKERLAKLVDLPVATLHLIHAGRQLQDHVTLGELGGRVNETVSLSLRSADPVVFPIKIKPGCLEPDDLMPLPDVITVRVLNPSKCPRSHHLARTVSASCGNRTRPAEGARRRDSKPQHLSTVPRRMAQEEDGNLLLSRPNANRLLLRS